MQGITISNPFTAKPLMLMAYYEKTRNGFRHVAGTNDGVKVKVTYWNRTWEEYTYQTALHELAHKWIVAATGWNPRTKRDGAKFDEVYGKMTKEIDEKRNWL